MVTILCALASIFEFRVRSRASLELELIALRHQVTVLRRQRPGRPQLSSLDRLLWVWLYWIWPQVIDAMVLVRPATVVQWHRKGFRLFLALAIAPSGTTQDRQHNWPSVPPNYFFSSAFRTNCMSTTLPYGTDLVKAPVLTTTSISRAYPCSETMPSVLQILSA
jgi:hypothetical protein